MKIHAEISVPKRPCCKACIETSGPKGRYVRAETSTTWNFSARVFEWDSSTSDWVQVGSNVTKVYDHSNSCPDLKDSVYLTPTSEKPFDPLQIACALGQKKRGQPPGNFVIPAQYTHKKLLKGRKNEWCTYKLTEYAEEGWFKKWKK